MHNILSEVFWAVEDYWEECTPEEEDKWTITEATMRQRVAAALVKLEDFLTTYAGSYWQDLPDDYIEQLTREKFGVSPA